MSGIKVKKRSGNFEKLDNNKINESVLRACEGLEDVSASELVLEAKLQLYDGIPTIEIDKALILTARSKICDEPQYSYVAARLLLNNIYKEVFGAGVEKELFEEQYKEAFKENIYELVEAGRLNEKLTEIFDLDYLSENIKPERDYKFKYMGIQTLYDRYFLHIDEVKKETPQAFFMRVAMGLALREKDCDKKAIEFYNVLSNFYCMSSTPTLFNSGTIHSQLSSCYLSTMDDSEDGIMGTIHDQARLSKYAGGIGVDMHPLRGMNSRIKGTNGKSSGMAPFAKILNSTILAFNQGGKRKGSAAIYAEENHIDIEQFLDLKKETGDDRLRCHDLNPALWGTDYFFRQIKSDAELYLFSPDETPDLHDLYGKEFDKKYNHYIKQAKAGKIKNFKVVKAKELFKKVLTSLFETGHPWINFKDAWNICYSNKNAGVIHSSNLCTEIGRHTHATKYKMGQKTEIGETAVCNLASVNLNEFIVIDDEEVYIDYENMKKNIHTTIRMLDNVIDENFYPIEEAKKSNMLHRPIGLGAMGFLDVLHAFRIPYESKEAVELAGEIQEFISYHAILASVELAEERGVFSSYKGSEWSKGNLPIDMCQKLHEYRKTKNTCPPAKIKSKEWEALRILCMTKGVRNGSIMAIAPTATISYICGCSQSIEPDISVLYAYETLSGTFTMINEWFVKRAKEEGIWSKNLVEALKKVDGDVNKLNISDKLKKEFKTAFDIDYHYLVDAASARQQWIDMGQSFNIYCDIPSMKHLADIYLYCFEKALKSTYYLRNRPKTKIEKSVDGETKEQIKTSSACSIEAMRRGEICESCQ